MTKKDYILIASTILKSKLSMYENSYISLVKDFSEALAVDNPRFNENIFKKACGL